MNDRSKTQVPICSELIALAERELGAFLGAVVSLYGLEQLDLAADAWIAEMLSIEDLTGFGKHDWRLVTLGTLARIADHLGTVDRTSRIENHLLPCISSRESLGNREG